MDERMAGIRKIRFEGRAARKAAQDAMESLTIEETKNEWTTYFLRFVYK